MSQLARKSNNHHVEWYASDSDETKNVRLSKNRKPTVLRVKKIIRDTDA